MSLLSLRSSSPGEGWQLGEDEERDTEPTPLRRPKRFDDWGSGGSGSGGSDEQWPRRLEGGGRPGGGTASSGGGAGEGPSQEQLEQQRRTRQLDSVARKLEKNGAQVRQSVCCLAELSTAVTSVHPLFIHDPKDS